MKFKDLLTPLILTILTMVALHYFWPPQQSQVQTEAKSGQRFIAPKVNEVEVLKPLNTEIDFSDQKSGISRPIISEVYSENARYQFSTEGASLERVEFKRNWGGKEGYLSTVFPPASPDKEQRTFLIALNTPTPYYFNLVNRTENDDQVVLEYQTESDVALIQKIFTIHKHEFKIDLALSIKPKHGLSIQPRIFFGSPLVPELGKDDTISAIVNDEHDTVQVYPKTEETLSAYWVRPSLFGSQDRYFVHSLVKDNDTFAQRGYYKIFDLETLYSILEGPAIKEETTWQLSFYMGPKIDETMQVVDPRLVQTLNYGRLSFISRPVSKVLLDLLNLIYRYVKNYGLAIIILTILMKIILFPLSIPFLRSRKKMDEFQKKLKYIEEKHKHDPKAMQAARAQAVAKQMSSMAGCLPQLLQIPPFIALNWVLSNSIELYKAPFLWVPDLSARDPYFILPIITGLATWLMSSQSQDPRQKVTSLVIGIGICALFANIAAGLTLFFAVSMLLGVAQQYVFKMNVS